MSSTSNPSKFWTKPHWYSRGTTIPGKPQNRLYMNENAVRARAGLLNITAWCVLCILLTVDKPGFIIYTIAPVVLWDFITATLFGLTPLSPYGILGTLITYNSEPIWKPANPKRFAWTLGFFMVISCMSFGSQQRKYIVMGHVSLCILLTWAESSLGFCAGCWLWNNYVAAILGKEECLECKTNFTSKDLKADLKSSLPKVKEIIASNSIAVFTKATCPHCTRAKKLLNELNIDFHQVVLDQCENPAGYAKALLDLTGQKTVPNIFISGKHIGGADDLYKLHSDGKLEMDKLVIV